MKEYRDRLERFHLGVLVRAGMALALLAGLTTKASAADELRAASMVDAPGLAAMCQPSAMQAIASKLSIKVTVKDLPDGEIPGAPKTGGAHFIGATAKMPAYCQVSGSYVTNPATGKTANFLATFPAAWNRKYMQLGCGGHCGTFAVSDAAFPTITISAQGYPSEIIAKGYASFGDDEGHAGFSAGNWAIKAPGQIDQDAVEDYIYRADKMLARMGKEFTKAFYTQVTGSQQNIIRSYFCGCSDGGRTALIAASYFPEEFDGIVAGSPAANLAGITLQVVGTSLAAIHADGAEVSPALIAQLDSLVMAKCDAVDGVKDGLIQNPGACNFRPEKDLPQCHDDKPGPACFTKAQIETVSTLLTGVTDENNRVVQPGYSVSELQGIGIKKPDYPNALDPWADSGNPNQGLGSLGDVELRLFVHKNDPNFHSRTLISFGSGGSGQVTGFRVEVPASEVSTARSALRMSTGNDPENAAKLIQLNHKLLIWSNLSDQLLTPYISINYYKQLAKMYGGYTKLQKNIRLFMVPNTSHCSGSGAGPGSFDAITAMENWVEKGKGPDSLVAGLYPGKGYTLDYSAAPLRTMPLCKFPEMAHYNGHGDVKDAVNWRCSPSDKAMLMVGESGRQAGEVR